VLNYVALGEALRSRTGGNKCQVNNKLTDQTLYQRAAEAVCAGKHVVAFTGAGISVESGIPPFRGANGLWSKYNPQSLDISFFLANPEASWRVIREIFYQTFEKAEPNAAHTGLAKLEERGLLKAVITQNIDNLHRRAGSRTVIEFHGNSSTLVCVDCTTTYDASQTDLSTLPPTCCSCGAILKPAFVFFGEPIPHQAYARAFLEAERADVLLVIGTTGEVMPAALVPRIAKSKGATLIEINPEESNFTREITDIFLEAKAAEAMPRLLEALPAA
jgi:NAD-dependent deacetylase